MTFLKPKGGDTFRSVSDDGSEAEDYVFQRDATGKPTSFTHFSNPHQRLQSSPPFQSSPRFPQRTSISIPCSRMIIIDGRGAAAPEDEKGFC